MMIKSWMIVPKLDLNTPQRKAPVLDIASSVLHCMHEAESNKKLTSGEDKRNYVIQRITATVLGSLGDGEHSELIEQLIPHMIEFIIDVSRSQVVIDINRKCKNKLLSCCR